MSVLIEAIKFNHDPNSAMRDAMNLRRDAGSMAPVPEWQRGLSVNPEDSPAAYAVRETTGQTLTIQASFRRSHPTLQTAEVRAIDDQVFGAQPGGCLGWLIYLFQLLIKALVGNVLGEVRARGVSFNAAGETGFQVFELTGVRLASAGVGIRTTSWRWQWRRSSAHPWLDMETTHHRIYCLLSLPTDPWRQAPYDGSNLRLPWIAALDQACRWGALAADADTAASRITEAVFNLGPGIITYDCPGGGSTHYAVAGFNLTAFLDRLRGGVGSGYYVNCTDCATIVSTFANLVGCDLWQSRMGWGFALNPLLGIGSSVWQPACGWISFSYHEVAWKGACTSAEEVFDACLKVDGDADPTVAPHVALLPVNLRFGNAGDGLYRDRLATPAGRATCNPQPTTRQRRAVY